MLERLHIKNVAVIDEAEIEFKNGFNVLTGETGAGKSIIIDSINMVLGERTNKALIRNGEKKAVAEALFYIENPSVLKELEECGVEAEDGTVVLYRDINCDGKSVCKINGSITTAANVREISKYLINIHGQQDNQALLSPSSHIHFLDSYAKTSKLISDYRESHNFVTELEDKIDSLQFDEREKERQTDLYQFQIEEIDAASLTVGEDERLNERKKFLNYAEKIAEAVNRAHSVLYDCDKNAYETISIAENCLSSVSEYDEKLAEMSERINSIAIDLEDAIYQIRDYRDSIGDNGNELNDVESRLDLINALKRKYGNTIEEIKEYRDDISAQLERIIKSDEEINRLKKQVETARKTREEYAKKLTETRKEAAKRLSIKICGELRDLDMAKVKFDVNIRECEYNNNGCDSVEFLISVNAGEPLKPLSKIASGGEMSRIMLAIKSIFADSDPVESLIFDEIDTGVSGRAAQKIAEKVNILSKTKQILCITHLPQIAAMADTHFLIEKSTENERTFTKVTELSKTDRRFELARIIGGAQITDTTVSAAAEMIKLAENFRNSN